MTQSHLASCTAGGNIPWLREFSHEPGAPSSGDVMDCSYLPWVSGKYQAQTRFLRPGKKEVAPVTTDRTLVGSCQRVDRIQPEGTPETKAQLRSAVYHHEEQNQSGGGQLDTRSQEQ